MQSSRTNRSKFALKVGREQIPLVSVTANAKPVTTAHELAHVVQQRHCEIQLVAAPDTSAHKTIIGGFKSVSGMDSETEVIDMSTPGVRISLGDLKLKGTSSIPPSGSRAGATTTIKLSKN